MKRLSYLTPQPDMIKVQLVILLSALTVVIEFINNWVWSPPWTFMFIIIVLISDWLSAIARDCKQGLGFSTKKSEKFWMVKVPMYLVILGIVHNLPKINLIFGPEAMQPVLDKAPGAIYVAVLSYTLTSVLKNCVLAGEFDGRVAQIINKYIDTYKNPKNKKH